MSEIANLFSNEESMDVKQKIVEEMLNEENLDRKTELAKPIRWACMDIIEQELEKNEMSLSSQILKRFTETSFKYLISKDRAGRKEYIEALNSLANMERKDMLQNQQQQKLLG